MDEPSHNALRCSPFQKKGSRKMHEVYQIFNKKAELLYIGVSKSTIGRLAGHQNKPWSHEITFIHVQHYSTRAVAESAEKDQIQSLNPKYNVMYNRNKSSYINTYNLEKGRDSWNFYFEKIKKEQFTYEKVSDYVDIVKEQRLDRQNKNILKGVKSYYQTLSEACTSQLALPEEDAYTLHPRDQFRRKHPLCIEQQYEKKYGRFPTVEEMCSEIEASLKETSKKLDRIEKQYKESLDKTEKILNAI